MRALNTKIMPLILSVTLINIANYPALAKDKSTQASRSESEAGPEKNPPKDLQKIRDIGPIGTTSHVLGTLIGIYPGFGLGHAVQGRWGYDGKIYTGLGFATLLLAPVAATYSCKGRKTFYKENGVTKSRRKYNQSDCITLALLATAFLAAKTSEIYSLIMDPLKINNKYEKYSRENLMTFRRPDLMIELIEYPGETTPDTSFSKSALALTASWSTSWGLVGTPD